MGEIYKRPSENILPIGPVSVDGKSFVAVGLFRQLVLSQMDSGKWYQRHSFFFLRTLLLEVQKSCFES
jgi:hypothetical protein